jgi:hypothetical protein
LIGRFAATRYVQPLREGGSLPAVVDTDGGGMYVVKFRGAGQGVKALIAELVVGQLALAAGLPTPEPALIEIPEQFGRSEPDPEIQDLLRASHGVNFGARYLDGAFNFDGNAALDLISPELAARIVWFDAFVSNPDRTHRNPNLMVCHREPFLIDHGAAIYAQHDWPSVDEARTRAPFQMIEKHVLLERASGISDVDSDMEGKLGSGAIREAVKSIPDEWLAAPVVAADFSNAEAARDRYAGYLETRLSAPRGFVTEAVEAQARQSRMPAQRLKARR